MNIEIIKTISEEEISKWDKEKLQKKFIEIQEITKLGQEVIIAQQKQLQLNKKVIDKRNTEKLALAELNIEKQRIIDEMSIELYNYANLNKLGVCEAELENGHYDMNLCKMSLADRNCCKCIKEYFTKKVEEK